MSAFAARDGAVPPAFRTVLCRYFQSGYCPAGEKCTFIHSSEDGQLPSTQQCRNFLMGACRSGINCPFAHSSPPMAYTQQTATQQSSAVSSTSTAASEYKMHLCPHSATGACGGAPYCSLPHSVGELIPGKISQTEIETMRRTQASCAGGSVSGGAQPQTQTQMPLQTPVQTAYALMTTPYGELDAYAAAYQTAGSSAPYACSALPTGSYNGADSSSLPSEYGTVAAHLQAAANASRFATGPAANAACAAQTHFAANPYTAAYVQPNAAYHQAVPPPPASAFASPLAHPKAKTKQCTFWPDRCRKGFQCPYIHGDNDPLHVGGPAARMQAAVIASMGVGSRSAFQQAPGVAQRRLRPPASVIGTKFCKFFLSGACTRGSECTFSHDQRVREREEQQKLQAATTVARQPASSSASEALESEQQTAKCPRTEGAASVADVLQRTQAQTAGLLPTGIAQEKGGRESEDKQKPSASKESMQRQEEEANEQAKEDSPLEGSSPSKQEIQTQEEGPPPSPEPPSAQAVPPLLEASASSHQIGASLDSDKEQTVGVQQQTPQTQPCSPELEAKKNHNSGGPDSEETVSQRSSPKANGGSSAGNSAESEKAGLISSDTDGLLPPEASA